jgi:AcrR family transcriptional regulator
MPISDCEVRDPRIRRTRQLLHGALRNLLHSRDFEGISVHDITEAATVNRATFYDHYTDKHALLEAMVSAEFHRLLEARNVRFDGSCASAAGPVILAACDFLTQCSSEEGPNRGRQTLEPLIDAAVTAAIRRVLLEGFSRQRKPGGLSAELVASATSGAIYGAAKEWANSPRRVASKKFVPEVLALIQPLLDSRPPVNSRAPQKGAGRADPHPSLTKT